MSLFIAHPLELDVEEGSAEAAEGEGHEDRGEGRVEAAVAEADAERLGLGHQLRLLVLQLLRRLGAVLGDRLVLAEACEARLRGQIVGHDDAEAARHAHRLALVLARPVQRARIADDGTLAPAWLDLLYLREEKSDKSSFLVKW